MNSRGPAAWFAFFRKEHAGAVLLFVLSVILALLPRIWSNYKPLTSPEVQTDTVLLSQIESAQKAWEDSAFSRFRKPRKNLHYASMDDLLKLGISSQAAEKITRIYKSGKTFRNYRELSAETGLDSNTLAKIVSPGSFRQYSAGKHETDIETPIELNSADTNILKSLPGIGSRTAARIVGYRDKLGGFFKAEQILETWYTDTVQLRKLLPMFTVNQNSIRKLQVATATEKELDDHPYINKTQARIIYNFIKQHGSMSLMEFQQMKAGFSPAEKQRLIPYLSF